MDGGITKSERASGAAAQGSLDLCNDGQPDFLWRFRPYIETDGVVEPIELFGCGNVAILAKAIQEEIAF